MTQENGDQRSVASDDESSQQLCPNFSKLASQTRNANLPVPPTCFPPPSHSPTIHGNVFHLLPLLLPSPPPSGACPEPTVPFSAATIHPNPRCGPIVDQQKAKDGNHFCAVSRHPEASPAPNKAFSDRVRN